MYWFRRGAACALIGMGLVGCSGLTQVQDSISRFDQGTHSASVAETNFLRAVQTADCTSQFYANASDWAIGSLVNFDISGTCVPTILDDKQVQTRQALMDAVTLYADKMVALATGDDNTALDANAQKLAGVLNSTAHQHGFQNLPVAADVEAGIIAISEMALDQRRFSDVKTAAAKMDGSLGAVIGKLKAENTNFAVGIASKIDRLETNLRAVVAGTHQDRRRMSFFDVVEARRIMRSANPFIPQTVIPSQNAAAPQDNAQSAALQLNAVLDTVLAANRAIAGAGTGGIVAAVNNLIVRAQDAQSVQASLNK